MKITYCLGLCGALFILISCSPKKQAATEPAKKEFNIGRMEKAPVLDGNLADWPERDSSILLGQAADTLPRPGKWDGTTDLSGVIRLAWDENYLYLAADVADDKVLQAAGTGAEPWQGDSIELFFNTEPGKQRTACFRQIALVPPLEAGKSLAVLCPQGDFPGVEGAAQVNEHGYTFECRIPWKNFNGFSPKESAPLGLQIMLDDRDVQGRKSQLCWYPSAITFNQPTQMNVIRLQAKADKQEPGLLAGITAACVTDPDKMQVSLLAEQPTAEKAVIQMKKNPSATQTLALVKVGKSAVAGSGTLPLSADDGEADFTVELMDGQGKVAAKGGFTVELAGKRYAAMKDQLKTLQDRLKAPLADAQPSEERLQERAGLGFWLQRIQALAFNEARPESVKPAMLDRMLAELDEIQKAADRFDKGEDPYQTQKGSLVRAYRSPLSGEFRPHALYVPESYRAGKPKPLIVVLHGIFGDERHLFELREQVKDLDAIVYQAASYRQFDWADISAAETWAGLDEVLKEYSVDPDRIYLMGHHIGGRGALQLALDRPDFFAAVAALYPGVDVKLSYNALSLYPQFYDQAVDNWIPAPHFKKPDRPEVAEGVEKQIMESLSLATRAENLVGLPLMITDGEADPSAAAERLSLLERLQALGEKVPFRYIPGAMHGGRPPELDEPAFYQWLLQQKKRKTPEKFTWVGTDLHAPEAWHLKVTALESPLKPGRIEVSRKDVETMEFKTSGVKSFMPLTNNAGIGPKDYIVVVIDGEVFPQVFPGDWKEWMVVKDAAGKWAFGKPPESEKRAGTSGPIDDFQRSGFLYVYGSTGTPEENALQEKLAGKYSNRSLGTAFPSKKDREVTEEDIQTKNLVLMGSPKTNSLLARMAGKLPIQWEAQGLVLGTEKVSGVGAGACVIYPNPLAQGHYVVVLTGVDEAGYRAWDYRAGVDFVAGATGEDGKSFTPKIRGSFANDWTWSPILTVTGK